MMTKQIPTWLDLDKIVPPDMRDQIPHLADKARDVVTTVESFIRDALPVWKEINNRIDAAHPGLDDWYRYMGALTGLDEVDELLEIAEWALTTIR